jgi:hypothetical protein
MALAIISKIQELYRTKEIHKTGSCIGDMALYGFLEADVEKVVEEPTDVKKVMQATSDRAHPKNIHFVIIGKSINGTTVYCKLAINHDLKTGEFIGWFMTSFKPE